MSNKKRPKEDSGSSKKRFDFSSSKEKFSTFSKGFQPPNTVSNTSWALRVLEEWMKARNAETDFEAETCPENLLSHSTKSAILEWLGRFAIEVRRHDGKQYPPKTIHLLLMGIQRHMCTVNPNRAISLFGDPEFNTLQNICDNLYRELHSEGICTETKPIAALTEDDECRLWSTGVINLTTPQGLANAVFFYNGKNFCLRGGQEHRDLKFSQLKRKTVEVKAYHTRGNFQAT